MYFIFVYFMLEFYSNNSNMLECNRMFAHGLHFTWHNFAWSYICMRHLDAIAFIFEISVSEYSYFYVNMIFHTFHTDFIVCHIWVCASPTKCKIIIYASGVMQKHIHTRKPTSIHLAHTRTHIADNISTCAFIILTPAIKTLRMWGDMSRALNLIYCC